MDFVEVAEQVDGVETAGEHQAFALGVVHGLEHVGIGEIGQVAEACILLVLPANDARIKIFLLLLMHLLIKLLLFLPNLLHPFILLLSKLLHNSITVILALPPLFPQFAQKLKPSHPTQLLTSFKQFPNHE